VQDYLMSTQKQPTHIESTSPASGARVVALDRLRELEPDDRAWEAELSAVSLGLVDAILQADVVALESAPDPVRDALARMFEDTGHAREIRGWLLGILAITQWSLQRLPSPSELELGQDSHARRFLDALARSDGSLASGEVRDLLSIDDSQMSRLGRKLLASGLVIQRRIGRTAHWELTPRGRQLQRQAGESRPPRQSPGAQSAGGGRRRTGRSR
jgi:hypothetical protein